MANWSAIFHCIWREMASLAVTMGSSARWLVFIATLGTLDLLQRSRLRYRSVARKDEPVAEKSKHFPRQGRERCGALKVAHLSPVGCQVGEPRAVFSQEKWPSWDSSGG
jgi:hypothetical protein